MANIDTLRTILSNDLVAKWVNYRDYALNTLYSKSDIADLMDEIDKYGYGDWVENSGTWGAKGNVPIMTSNTAPYGTASIVGGAATNNPAWHAFDNNEDTWAGLNSGVSGSINLLYIFVNPVNVRRLRIRVYDNSIYTGMKVKLGYSDDGTNFTYSNEEISTIAGEYVELNVSDYGYHSYWGANINNNSTSANNFATTSLQFYGRELKPLVPVMTDNDKPKGEAFASNMFATYYPWKAFDGNKSAASGAWAYYNNGGNIYPVSVGYDFKRDVLVKYVVGYNRGDSSETYAPKTFKVQGYKNNEWADLTDAITNTNSSQRGIFASRAINANDVTCEKCQLYITDGFNNVEVMVQELQFYGFDYSEKEFATGSTMKYIYDHGVNLIELEELSTANGWSESGYTFTSPVLKDYMMDISPNGGSRVMSGIGSKNILALGSYNRAYMKADTVKSEGTTTAFRILSASKTNFNTSYISSDSSIPSTPEVSLDIQTVNDAYLSVSSINSVNRRMYVYEIWLE